MPEAVKEFLDGLSTSDAEKVWGWFDGDPDAVNTMIERLCEHHPDMSGLDDDPLGEKLVIRGTGE